MSDDSRHPSERQLPEGAGDFDFLIGQWRIHNRRLKERLVGADDWEEFEATLTAAAGQPGPLHFMNTCKTVQRMGKNLQISISPDELPEALENLSSRGLHIATGARSEDHAREIIEQACQLSVDRG